MSNFDALDSESCGQGDCDFLDLFAIELDETLFFFRLAAFCWALDMAEAAAGRSLP